MSLILLIFIPPQVTWQIVLKKTKVKLDLLTYIYETLLMVEKGIRLEEESANSSICKS